LLSSLSLSLSLSLLLGLLSKGAIADNAVIACWHVNVFKSDHSISVYF
jgi:hypothetical protein